MESDRHFAGIGREIGGHDGQSLQHFMTNSPWSGERVYEQIQAEICELPQLAQGSILLLDESADEKAGTDSAGSSRQYNGRRGKVDVCQVAVVLSLANWKTGPWPIWSIPGSTSSALRIFTASTSLPVWLTMRIFSPSEILRRLASRVLISTTGSDFLFWKRSMLRYLE